MENFVFPDEMKTKLYTILQKKLQKVIIIFTKQTVKKAFTFWTGVVRQMH